MRFRKLEILRKEINENFKFFNITNLFRYKFEEYTAQELEKMKTQSKLSKIREEKQKELELKTKIMNIKKKQEEEIAKYIGDVRKSTYPFHFHSPKYYRAYT